MAAKEAAVATYIAGFDQLVVVAFCVVEAGRRMTGNAGNTVRYPGRNTGRNNTINEDDRTRLTQMLGFSDFLFLAKVTKVAAQMTAPTGSSNSLARLSCLAKSPYPIRHRVNAALLPGFSR